jgi:hypothetical protein
MMMSNEDSVTSAMPTVSNEDLVAMNPMYQHLINNDPDAYYPWTSNLDEIATEEEEIAIPCGFTSALYAMTATTDEQLNDYYALLDTHVTAEFAAAVPIMEFMRDEGIKVFTNMHMNWEGIQGIDLFELDWKKDTPAVLKPTCRPIKKIFMRLPRKSSIG